MTSRLSKRLSIVERLAAEKTKDLSCNCRKETQYHNAKCLDALLKRMPRVCRIHGFRDLGYLNRVPSCFPLMPGDIQFCPCPSDPRRALALMGVDLTLAEKTAAIKASPSSPNFDWRSEYIQGKAIRAEYWKAREQWSKRTGRQLPSQEELWEVQGAQMRELSEEAKRIILNAKTRLASKLASL